RYPRSWRPPPTYTLSLFNHTPPAETYTLSLHDALPILDGEWQVALEVNGEPATVRHSDAEEAYALALLQLVTGEPAMRQGRSATDRKSTRLNSSHDQISYAVFCLKKKKTNVTTEEASVR